MVFKKPHEPQSYPNPKWRQNQNAESDFRESLHQNEVSIKTYKN